MAHYTFGTKEIYIDGRLKTQFVDIVVPDLAKKDKDAVFIVDGRERAGKSVFAMQLGGLMASSLGTTYDISNICMTPEEFRQRVIKSKKNEVIIYDEAHRGMGSRRALSEINKILVDLMMEMGQKNLFVIIVLPTFFLLDRYPALFRARGLFHIYERKGMRGFWCYFNEKNKFYLFMKGKKEFNYNCMKWPQFRGRFLDQYVLNESLYRDKKKQAFNQPEAEPIEHKYLIWRDKFIAKLAHEVGEKKTSEIMRDQMELSMSARQIARIKKKYRELFGKRH
jgi:hypothetical protein